MKTKKDLRKKRLELFRKEALPKLSKLYKVSGHGPANAPNTMYKIFIHSQLEYDFYPMSEKIRKAKYSLDTNRTISTWKDLTLNELLVRLTDHKNK